MRRQNEILRILKEMGGCANMTTQELQDTHTKHLAVLAERGEHTSAPPGTLIDKRTLKLTIDALEDRGSIKKTTAMVRTANGIPKPSIVISLPDLDPEVLKQYIVSLDGMLTYHPPGTRRMSDAVEYGITVNQRGRALADQMPVPKRARLDEASDPDDMRKLIQGEQRVTIQSAGFLLGRFARARELHMFLLSQMEDVTHQSQRFVSTNNRIFEIKYLWEDIPVGLYCAINSVIAIHEPLIEYLSYESNRWVPCGNIPGDLKEVLGVGRAKSRKAARSTLDLLIQLGVLTPLTPSTSSTPLVTCAPNGLHPTSFDLYTDNAMMPLYGMFNEKASIYLFQLSEESPPLAAIHDVSTAEERSLYWQILHDASNISIEPSTLTPIPNGPIFSGGIEFVRSIRKPFSWISSYALSPLQCRFLTSLIDPVTGANPVEDEGVLDSACYVTGAPPDTIRSYLETQSAHTKRAIRRIARRETRKIEERERRAEAKRILTSKALEAKQRVERIWVELLNRAHPSPLTAEEHNRLSTIHQSFVNSAGRLGGARDENELKTEILAALEAGRRRGPGSIPAEVSARLRLAAPRMAPRISGAGKVKTSTKSVYDLVQQQQPREPILRKTRKARKRTVEGTGGDQSFIEFFVSRELMMRERRRICHRAEGGISPSQPQRTFRMDRGL
jgi:oxalate---CoA ligase